MEVDTKTHMIALKERLREMEAFLQELSSTSTNFQGSLEMAMKDGAALSSVVTKFAAKHTSIAPEFAQCLSDAGNALHVVEANKLSLVEALSAAAAAAEGALQEDIEVAHAAVDRQEKTDAELETAVRRLQQTTSEEELSRDEMVALEAERDMIQERGKLLTEQAAEAVEAALQEGRLESTKLLCSIVQSYQAFLQRSIAAIHPLAERLPEYLQKAEKAASESELPAQTLAAEAEAERKKRQSEKDILLLKSDDEGSPSPWRVTHTQLPQQSGFANKSKMAANPYAASARGWTAASSAQSPIGLSSSSSAVSSHSFQQRKCTAGASKAAHTPQAVESALVGDVLSPGGGGEEEGETKGERREGGGFFGTARKGTEATMVFSPHRSKENESVNKERATQQMESDSDSDDGDGLEVRPRSGWNTSFPSSVGGTALPCSITSTESIVRIQQGEEKQNTTRSLLGKFSTGRVDRSGNRLKLDAAASGSYDVAFEVSSASKSRRPKWKVLKLNLSNGEILMRGKLKSDEQKKPLSAAELLQVKRSTVNNRKLKLFWKSKSKPNRFIFSSFEQKERFYEFAYLAQNVALGRIDLANINQAEMTENFRVFIGTWNMGNASPPSRLSPWIPERERYDIYVFATQECEYDVSGTGHPNCEAAWFASIRRELGDGYVTLASVSLLMIRLVVFVSRDAYNQCSSIKTDKVATGAMNLIGNKGGVGISFNLNETRLCFINCHLAAGKERCPEREIMFQAIASGLRLGSGIFDALNYFHHVFWIGDYNYRVALSRDLVLRVFENADSDLYPSRFEQVLKKDQLRIEMDNGRVFSGFKEAPITFRPSYRYNRNEVDAKGYRTFSPEKLRTPSWCDRVMWRSLEGTSVECKQYTSCDELMSSDHSPVYAVFELETRLPNLPHEYVPVVIRMTELEGEEFSLRAVSPMLFFFAANCIDGVQCSNIASCERPSSTDSVNDAAATAYHRWLWRDTDLPLMQPITTNVEFLRSLHILVMVKDKDLGEMGQCHFPLRNACGDAPAAFQAQLTYKGINSGRLKGKVHVEWQTTGDSSAVTYAGFLTKQGNKRKNWKKRWFELHGDGSMAYYYHQSDAKCISSFQVGGAVVDTAEASTGKANCFSIKTPLRTYYVYCDSTEDLRRWARALENLDKPAVVKNRRLLGE